MSENLSSMSDFMMSVFLCYKRCVKMNTLDTTNECLKKEVIDTYKEVVFPFLRGIILSESSNTPS